MKIRNFLFIAGGIAVVTIALSAITYFLLRSHPINTVGQAVAQAGYIELRPASNLVTPGTWVEVLDNHHLHLSVICDPKDALGIADESEFLTSPANSISVQNSMTPKFELDANTINRINLNGTIKPIRNIELKLSNVRLLEVADAAVLKNIKSRSKECAEAIKLRIKSNKHPITMIKSALIADVDYEIHFSGNVNAQTKVELASKAASVLGAIVDVSEGSEIHLVGQNLVWGIRDDVVLATVGVELPSTGGVPESRSILKGKGPVEETDTQSVARRNFAASDVWVRWEVPIMKQATSMGCWATVYAMMLSWKDKREVSVSTALSELGGTYLADYLHGRGLTGGAERVFASLSMEAEPPASYELSFWKESLKKYGPLWVTLGDGISSHAILLVGLYGPDREESQEAYNQAVFEFVDPASGSYVYRPAITFLATFEEEAAAIVSADDNVDLRWQVIHWRA